MVTIRQGVVLTSRINCYRLSSTRFYDRLIRLFQVSRTGNPQDVELQLMDQVKQLIGAFGMRQITRANLMVLHIKFAALYGA